ncbi:MAG TPA: FAD-dependent oxidoreductase [Tepidisphaeraceae bacterium]|jgi:3-phenylpropionate/trans-cinnamate dioxygenase ferredoxin reductase subunit|nr:FAD-dependent oxidoreductase [Tepidisphaeraceae bacterium]
MSTHVKYLLIGGGPASSAAAEAIRTHDREGDLLLIGQEINRPYRRGPLAGGYLAGTVRREDLFTQPAGWFAEHGVQLRTGRQATHLDPARATVMLDDGRDVSYDKLLIATGAAAVRISVPGSELPGLYYLRTLEDANRLHTAIEKAKADGRPHERGRGRALVIGAGLQGAELAATLTTLGIAVTLTTALPHAWGRFAGDATAAYVTRVLEAHGVAVRAGLSLARLAGDGRVQRAVFADDSTVDCDFVVVAMGVTPVKQLLRGTSISAERAILVDEAGRTNVPGIFAAGDCCAFYDPLFGKHRLSDHWDSAPVTGAIAGRNMAGEDVRFDGVSTFASRVFDIALTGYGEPRFVDRRIVRGQPGAAGGFIEIGIATDGRVCQVLCVDCEEPAAAELVRHRVNVNGREESLKDPHQPLAGFVG